MPTIICSYCEYVGQGNDYEERIDDVEIHEEWCKAKLADEIAQGIDAAYEQARADGLITFESKNL